jgi:hypothetical protein
LASARRTSVDDRHISNQITYSLRVDECKEDHQREDRHIPNTITYTLKIGKREEDVSEKTLQKMVTYILMIGGREDDISETMGTCQAR